MRRSGAGGNALLGNAVAVLGFVGNAFVLSCAPPTRYEQPSALRGYEILITRRDSLGQGVAEELRHRGFTVRREVRGGSRPTAYLLTFTAQPRAGQDKDLSETLLEKLAGHPDEATAQLSQWALDFRFAPDGTIRPLLEAP